MDLLTRFAFVALLLLVTAAVGRLIQRRDGRVIVSDGAIDHAGQRRLGLDPSHGAPRAVLFGSPTCAPCVTVKQVLGEVQAERDDFAWSYVDAADHLDLADEHNVRRVPTLLVLDGEGRVVARTFGVPRRDDLVATLATA